MTADQETLRIWSVCAVWDQTSGESGAGTGSGAGVGVIVRREASRG